MAEIVYSESNHRVYHQVNFLELKVRVEKDFKALIILIEYRNSEAISKELMNLSPTFDKTNPTIWRIPKQVTAYIRVKKV